MERFLITENGNILDTLKGCFFNSEGIFLRDVKDYIEFEWLVGILTPAEIKFSIPISEWKFLWKTFAEKERFFFLRRNLNRYEFRVIEKTSIPGIVTDDFGIHVTECIPTALPVSDTDINIGFLAYVNDIESIPLVTISLPSSFNEAVGSVSEGDSLTESLIEARIEKIINLMKII